MDIVRQQKDMCGAMSEHENKFCFVAPMFNASATLPQLLHSLYGQSYRNWKLILIDDVSEITELEKEVQIFERFERAHGLEQTVSIIEEEQWNGVRSGEKATLIINAEKRWEVSNVLRGISMCADDDIVCRIDADDWLTDLDALMYLNSVYQQTNAEALWTAHRWAFTDRNISAPMPPDADPYKHPWVSSHLKTFRKRLINGVPDINFRGEDGQYIRRAGDQAIYLPVLHRAKRRGFIPRVFYHYTIKDVPATYQTPDARFQRDEAIFLRARGYVQEGGPWESELRSR
jgi:glycosyltransferase involved in cell wall biosynthesis